MLGDSNWVRKEYLKGASIRDPNIVKGALIVEGFLKGAYRFIWMGYEYNVGGPVDNSHISFSRMKIGTSYLEVKNKYRHFDIVRFLQKTSCTENTRGEYRYRLEGFPVG